MFTLALATVMFVGAFIWPTRYRYENVRYGSYGVIVRVDRFTDKPEYLIPGTGKWQASIRPY